MLLKILILLTTLVCYECTLFSSFWAPLFNPRILNYKVDIPFNPDSGKKFRDDFQSKHGFRGETLIANLGNGKGPEGYSQNKDLGDVKFSYTYKNADKNSKYIS
ncbi:unnamed protein product, partial [Brenthis ino]